MKSRSKEALIRDLKAQLVEIQKLIEDIIHLDEMRVKSSHVNDRLHASQESLKAFYDATNVPLTPANIKFFDDTFQVKELKNNIDKEMKRKEYLKTCVLELEHTRNLRMKPLNDLLQHLSQMQPINQSYVDMLLSNAKTLNPEGSLPDKIKMVCNIVLSIISLQFKDVQVIVNHQQNNNALRASINGVFKRSQSKEHVESDAKPQHKLR